MPSRKGSPDKDSIVIRHGDSTAADLQNALQSGRFHYVAGNGITYTAQPEKRKIKRQTSTVYTAREWWYGYLKASGKTISQYIGKTDRIDFARLERAAVRIASKSQVTQYPETPTRNNQDTPPATGVSASTGCP